MPNQISRYQDVLKYASSKVNYTYGLGLYMSPSDMILQINTISGYYYRNDEFLPIYEQYKSKQLSSKDIVQILLTSEYTSPIIARTIPTSVENNCTFIVDTKAIGNWKDLLADDTGAWTVIGRKVLFVEFDGSDCIITQDREPGSDFQLVRNFHRNDSSKDFHRVIVVLQSLCDKTILALCLVQYYFDNEKHPIVVKPNGNSKQSKAYMRTQYSVMDKIKRRITSQSPKEVVHTVIESIGGTEKNQILWRKGYRQAAGKKPLSGNQRIQQIYCWLQRCIKKKKKDTSKTFIRNLTVNPEFTVVLTDQQLLDIERFCIDPRQFCVLAVDTTFNLGNYYITMTTYRHLQLLTKQKTHPVMIVPVLLHQQTLQISYIKLPSAMLELRPALRDMVA